MKITLIRRSGYVVRYFDKNGRKIGYSTCSEKELDKELKVKEFLGKEVSYTECNKLWLWMVV